MIEVEAGFDERDFDIEELGKQLQEPVQIEPKKEEKKSWWKFWK
jgi:hypothetical protein